VPYNLNETFVTLLSSTAGGTTKGVADHGPAGKAGEALALRRRALREAQLWTKIIARRNGWKLQATRTGSEPDKTADALRQLNWG
jgi:hypothetical protein